MVELFSIFGRIKLDDADFQRGISAAESSGRGLGGIMADMGKAVATAAVAMGAALVGIGVASASVGREIDASMGAIRAQTGMAADQTEFLRAEWHAMAKEGGHSLQEIASAYADIAVAGNTTTHALDVMTAAMKLADATGNSLGQSAYFLGNYLLKVGADSSMAEKYVDLFAIGIQNTGIGLGDLQNYVFRMTPAFEQFGASSETNIAILTRLYQAGIRGANLYSGMGTIMMQAATGVGQFGEMLDSLNAHTEIANYLSFEFYEGMILNEAQLFELATAMRDYTDQTGIASVVANQLNQTQQAAWFEFMNLADEIQNEVIPTFDRYGVAAEMAAERIDPVERGLRSMRGAFTYLKDTVWDFIRLPVGEAFEGMASKMTGLATTFAPLLGGALGGLVGILTGAEGASEKFSDSIGGIAEEISRHLPVFLERGTDIIINLMTGVTSALPTLVEGIVEIVPTVAQTIMGALPELITAGISVVVALIDGMAVMLPDLVPIAIEGIVTIVTAILDNAPLLIDAAIGLVGALVTALTDPANLAKLAEAAPQIIRLFGLYLAGKTALASVGVAASAIIGKLKAGLLLGKAAMALPGKAVVGAFKLGVKGAGAGLKLAGKGLVALLKLGLKGGKIAIGLAGKGLGVAFKLGVKGAASVVKLGGKVVSGLGKALKGGKGVMSKAGGGMATAFTGAIKGGGAAKAGKGLLAAIGPKGWIAGGIAAVGVVAYRNREVIGDFFGRMGDTARYAASAVWEATKEGAERVREFVGNVGDRMGEAVSGMRDRAGEMVQGFKDGFNARREQGYGVIMSFAGGVLDVAREHLGPIGNVGAETVEAFADGFNNRREQGYGIIRSFAGGVLDAARIGLEGMRQIGENAASSFSEGFNSRRDEGQSVVRSFFGGVVDASRSALGINSPSRIFTAFAANSADSYMDELKRKRREIYATVEDVFGGVEAGEHTHFTGNITGAVSTQAFTPYGGGANYHFAPGAIVIDAKNVKDFTDVVDLLSNYTHNMLVVGGE